MKRSKLSRSVLADRRDARAWLFAAAVMIGIGLVACAPAGETAEEDEGEAAPAAEGEMAATGAAQEGPACRFTASGEQLTGRASPPDSAMAQLGGATFKLCYSAPSMRDREIMGGLVPYGEPWRMGANEPTTLHVPVAAEVGSVRVEPGSYALYAIPGESEWTIVVNAAPERWGIPIDDDVRAQDVGSFPVQPESLEQPVERMTIRLDPQDGSVRAVLEWERTRVSFPIRRAAG